MNGVMMPLLIGTLVVSIMAFGGMLYNFQSDEVFAHTHPTHITKLPEPYDDRDILTSLTQIQTYHTSIDNLLIDLRTDVAILKARGDVTTLPTTPSTSLTAIDLNLYTQDNKGSNKSIFSRDTPVILITGQSEYEKKDFAITIRAPSGNFVKDRIVQTFSDGDISEAWIIPDGAEIGVYTVKITINSRSDTIEFQLT